MDRVIENKRWIKKKYIPYLAGGALALILVIWLIFGNHLSTLKVDKRLLTIEPAQQGQFNDYVRVNGQVQPVTTIQLSPLESGMVEEKLVASPSCKARPTWPKKTTSCAIRWCRWNSRSSTCRKNA